MKHYHTKLIPPFALAYAENMYIFFPHLQGFLPTFSLFEVWESNLHEGIIYQKILRSQINGFFDIREAHHVK